MHLECMLTIVGVLKYLVTCHFVRLEKIKSKISFFFKIELFVRRFGVEKKKKQKTTFLKNQQVWTGLDSFGQFWTYFWTQVESPKTSLS